jgi:hypothetical protein
VYVRIKLSNVKVEIEDPPTRSGADLKGAPAYHALVALRSGRFEAPPAAPFPCSTQFVAKKFEN